MNHWRVDNDHLWRSSSSKQGHLELRTRHSLILNISKDEDSIHNLAGQSVFHHLSVADYFFSHLCLNGTSFVFPFVPLASHMFTGHQWEVWLWLLYSLPPGICTHWQDPSKLSLKSEQTLQLSASPHMTNVPSLWASLWPFARLIPLSPCLCSSGESRIGGGTPDLVSPKLSERL